MSWTYDDFSTALDSNYWTTVQGSPSTSGGVLVLTPGAAGVKQVKSTINLTGDFDIQADFVYTNTATDSWYFYMLVGAADYITGTNVDTNTYSYYMRLGRCYHSGGFIKNWSKGAGTGAPTLDGSVANTGTSSKFRLTRSGSTFKAYYDIGGGWVQVGAGAGINITSADVKIVFDSQSVDSYPTPTTTVDNVVVNAGYINLTGSMTAPALTINADAQVIWKYMDLTFPAPVMSSFMQGTWAPYMELEFPKPFISAEGTASALARAEFTLPMAFCSADTPVAGNVYETLPSMTCDAVGNVSLVSVADIYMPRVAAVAALFTGCNGDASADLSALSVDARGGNIIVAALPSAVISSSGFSGVFARAEIEMPPARMSASGFLNPMLDADIALPAARLRVLFLDGTVGVLDSRLPAASVSSLGYSGSVSSSSSILSTVSLKASGYGAYTMSASMELPVPRIRASLDALRRQTLMTAVVNAKTGGVTTYGNYSFDSYAALGDSLIAACQDGIYLLEGNDDDGSDIAASLRTPPLALGLPGLKRLRELHLSMISTGPLTVKVISDDGLSHYYTAPSSAGALKTERVKTGRGVKGGFFSVEVQNIDGCDMKIERLEAAADALKRRI